MDINENLEFVGPRDLRALLERPQGPTVSIYHPTNRVAVDPEENSLHLKNLLRQGQELLVEAGMRRPVAAKLLEPAVSLLGNDDYWFQQLEGLAIFLDRQGRTHFRLPEKTPEVVAVAEKPYIKPMLSSVFPNVQFYVLALSQKNVRLLHCSRYVAEELDLSRYGLPTSFDEMVQFEVPDGTDPQHLPTAGSGLEFRQISRTLDKVLGTEHVPLILSGVDWVQAKYRDVSSYRPIVDEYIEGNSDRLSVQDLHEQAIPVIGRYRRAEVDQWKEDIGTLGGRNRASADLKKILFSAHEARIARLFIRDGVDEVWGRYDGRGDAMEIHDERLPGDYDLHDLAARQTVLTDGEALLLPPEDMPAGAPIVATYRW